MMRWSINKEVDGVITDDPKRFLEVCREWEDQGRRDVVLSWTQWAQVAWIFLMRCAFEVIFHLRYRGKVDSKVGKEGKLMMKA